MLGNQGNNRMIGENLALVVALFCLISGILLIVFFENPEISLAPSILLGLAVAIFVQYWLGGLGDAEKNSLSVNLGIYAGKVVGGVAITAILAILFQQLLLNSSQLVFEPREYQSLVVVDPTAAAIPLKINLGKKPSEEFSLTQSRLLTLKLIKAACQRSEGICEELSRPVNLTIDSRLKKGYATMCDSEKDLDQTYLNLAGDGEAVTVLAIAKDACPREARKVKNQKGQEVTTLRMKISKEDMKVLNPGKDEKVEASVNPSRLKIEEREKIYKDSEPTSKT